MSTTAKNTLRVVALLALSVLSTACTETVASNAPVVYYPSASAAAVSAPVSTVMPLGGI